ncbi:MAG: pyocin knob domain-containing protein [Eubacterium sp.]|nr:pyocin knob domain-containing protein [Eubacterium sp.]
MNKTVNYSLNKPEQTDYYEVDDFNKNADIIDEELSKCAKKANKAVMGNLAELDANGDLIDSGKKIADIVTKPDTITNFSVNSISGATHTHAISGFFKEFFVSSGSNADDIKIPGLYQCVGNWNPAIKFPVVGAALRGTLLVMQAAYESSFYLTQVFFSSRKIVQRYWEGNVWSAWTDAGQEIDIKLTDEEGSSILPTTDTETSEDIKISGRFQTVRNNLKQLFIDFKELNQKFENLEKKLGDK